MKGYFKKKGEKIMTKRFGFTLAEVLITLGIIGVVAAMTMPTLMNSTQGAQYKSAYKKALSALGQAITLNVALDGGNFYDAIAGSGTNATTDQSTAGTIANILSARMNVVNASNTRTDGVTPAYATDVTATLPTVNTYLYFNDGAMLAFDGKDAACTLVTDAGATAKVCLGYIDVNGSKGPNKVVTCNTASETAATFSGTGKVDNVAACEVSNPTDIYPVALYDQTVMPATNAANAVLYGK